MEYIKCVISDSSNPYAYFAYKNYDEGKNAEIKSRNFPLEFYNTILIKWKDSTLQNPRSLEGLKARQKCFGGFYSIFF